MTLAQGNFIGPKTLLETLNFADPDDAAGDGALWTYSLKADGGMSYISLNFPELAAKLQQMQAQAQAQAQQQQAAQTQQEAQGVAQKQAQGAQAAQQQLTAAQASHEQKLQHEQESHAQKMNLAKESASAALAAKTGGATPK